MSKSIRIIQITDTHLYADASQRLLGLATEQSFAAVLEAIKADYRSLDLALLTGDLSQDQSMASYQRLAGHIEHLKIPAYWIPGNHDEPSILQQGLTGHHLHSDKAIIKNHWQIILLNSHKPKAAEGSLTKAELDFLEVQLQEHPEQHTLICLHHQPIAIGSPWLDKVSLQNSAEFLAIVDRYPQVRGILNGHVHQEFAGFHKKIPVWATPSTCIQFKPKSPNFTLDIIPPGYRFLELHANGMIHTKIHRVTTFTAFTDADAASKGY